MSGTWLAGGEAVHVAHSSPGGDTAVRTESDAKTPRNASGLEGATVIFDLDGTLVDTAPDLVRALNVVIAADGFPLVPIAEVRAMVGRGARALLRRAYARLGTAMPEPVLDERFARFLAAYAADVADQSRPFPGAEEAVDALERAGAVCVIATNKPQRHTDRLLEALGWSARFERVIGADRASRRKPHAAHLIEAAGGRDRLARAVMIGDSDIDVAAARATGVPVAVMRHGYSETPADRLGADRALDALEDVPAAAAALLSVRRVD
jgi:phosphoglycolate phosphatase